jgi:hypothetical protein
MAHSIRVAFLWTRVQEANDSVPHSKYSKFCAPISENGRVSLGWSLNQPIKTRQQLVGQIFDSFSSTVILVFKAWASIRGRGHFLGVA